VTRKGWIRIHNGYNAGNEGDRMCRTLILASTRAHVRGRERGKKNDYQSTQVLGRSGDAARKNREIYGPTHEKRRCRRQGGEPSAWGGEVGKITNWRFVSSKGYVRRQRKVASMAKQRFDLPHVPP